MASVGLMDYRPLGRSGFKVGVLTYGNWVTHGSQIEEDAARECVRAALDPGFTTFDTADQAGKAARHHLDLLATADRAHRQGAMAP